MPDAKQQSLLRRALAHVVRLDVFQYAFNARHGPVPGSLRACSFSPGHEMAVTYSLFPDGS